MELEIDPEPTEEERLAIEKALEDEVEEPRPYESAWRRAGSEDWPRKIAGAPRA